MAQTGAQLLVQRLKEAGVDTLFSLSGNQIMPVYDACIDGGIHIIHVRHESAAVFMADAYAQVTGKLAVAMVTAGPGFGNAVSPVFSALMNESPVLFLSGDSPVALDGMGAFQEMDQQSMIAPVVKSTARPKSPTELCHAFDAALVTSLSGRMGPTHISLAFDVLNQEGDNPSKSQTIAVKDLSTADAMHVADAIANADKPIIFTGPMLNEGRGKEELAALRDAFQIPVINLESPRGLRDPSLGTFVKLMKEADLVVSIGKELNFTTGFMKSPTLSEDVKVIAIDPDPSMLKKTRERIGPKLTTAIEADMRPAALALAAVGKTHNNTAWLAAVTKAATNRKVAPLPNNEFHSNKLALAVKAKLESLDNPILVCDGGEIGQWIQGFCPTTVRITNGMSGAIGGAIPYALGAKVAKPDATVVALMGDGTAGFHFPELDTAARANLAFVAIVGNDDQWNAEVEIQKRDYGPNRVFACELSEEARYDLGASAFGCQGALANSAEEFSAAFDEAVTSNKPSLINARISGYAAPVYLDD